MFNVKMSKRMEKTCKNIGLIFLCIAVMWTTWWSCETIYTFSGYLRRGFDANTAWTWTMDDIDYEMEQLNEYIENLFPKRERRNEIKEYPIANWNITWNTLNKP